MGAIRYFLPDFRRSADDQSAERQRSIGSARLGWRQFASPLQLSALVVIALSLLPLGYLLWRAQEAIAAGNLDYLLTPNSLRIIGNSLLLTVTVVLSASLISLPFAWLTARTDLPGRRLWLVLGMLPVAIPSYLGAVTLNRAFGPRGMLQGLLEPLGVERLPGLYGFFGAWLSLTLFHLPLHRATIARGVDEC